MHENSGRTGTWVPKHLPAWHSLIRLRYDGFWFRRKSRVGVRRLAARPAIRLLDLLSRTTESPMKNHYLLLGHYNKSIASSLSFNPTL